MADDRKQGYLLENFRLFHLTSPQGAKTEFHYHEFCKILLLLSGSGCYSVGNQHYLLQAGDVVLIKDGDLHRPELDDVPYERIILYISPEYLRAMSTADCDLYRLFSGKKGHVLRLGTKRQQKIFALAETLEKDLSGRGFGRELLVEADLLRLLIAIGRRQARGEDAEAGMPQNERIREIIRHIDSHVTEDLDLDSLSRDLYISKSYMQRLFRDETGTTIHLYILQKRVLLAQSLIRSGMRATEACYNSGFHSYSSFSRACERYLGVTPTGKSDLPPAGEDIPE